MTKAELLLALEGLADDEQVTIAIFGDRNYMWHLCELACGRENDPKGTIALVHNGHVPPVKRLIEFEQMRRGIWKPSEDVI